MDDNGAPPIVMPPKVRIRDALFPPSCDVPGRARSKQPGFRCGHRQDGTSCRALVTCSGSALDREIKQLAGAREFGSQDLIGDVVAAPEDQEPLGILLVRIDQ